MSRKRQENLTESVIPAHLVEYIRRTTEGQLKWRLSGGSRWCTTYYNDRSWKMYVSEERLIFHRPVSSARAVKRYVSRKLTGAELGPLLEAIIFSRENTDG